MELEYIGHVNDDGLKIPQSKRLKNELIENFKGKQVTVIFKENKKSKRHVFNRFYWKYVIRPIIKGLIDMGYDRESVSDEQIIHEYLKKKFLGKTVANEDGDFLELPGSTKKLTNTKMLEYLEDIIRWSAEYIGITITFPWEILNEEETYTL